MSVYTNHKQLYVLALSFFVTLTIIVAVLPALDAQQANSPLPGSKPLSQLEREGKNIFIAEGCVACHTQQVRNVEMDSKWGSRPSIAADYAGIERADTWRNTATLMGSERTGPDLSNVGNRQSSTEWHLMHLYNPRSVVAGSVMPAYPWLFEIKDYKFPEDVTLNVPDGPKEGVIVASRHVLALVAYLQSLKQVTLPDGRPVPVFLYGKDQFAETNVPAKSAKQQTGPDGEALYLSNCASCHQPNGQGLVGAFPALKGSSIVLDPNPEIQVTVIMKGYNGRASEGYGAMPAVGTNNDLKPEEVAAIINHERSSWGNNSTQVTADQVKKIIANLK